MKGLLIGYVLYIFSFSLTIVDTFTNVFRIYCNHSYCSIVYCSLATLLSVVGFVTHCLLAHWYKRRVRDDIIGGLKSSMDDTSQNEHSMSCTCVVTICYMFSFCLISHSM